MCYTFSMRLQHARVTCLVCMVLTLSVMPCVSSFAFTLPFDELDANAGLILIASSPPSDFVDPTHAVSPLFGVSVPFRIGGGPFFVEPGLEFLGTYYEWTGNSAVLTQMENGVGFFTVGALLSLQGGASWPVARDVSLGGAIGLDFLIRFPFELQNTGSTVKSDQGEALSFFYGKGRFFYPETRFFVRWHLSEPVDLLVNLRAFYPVFHLWDGDGQPFWDQLMVSIGVGFAIRLKPAPARRPGG